MNSWERITKDLQKGLKEGVDAVKQGAAIIKKRAEDLSGEAQKQYKVFELKSNVHKLTSELGGRIYELHSKTGDPLKNKRVQSVISKIKKLEEKLSKLETGKAPGKKTRPGRKTGK
jgi:gas vesicle protein